MRLTVFNLVFLHIHCLGRKKTQAFALAGLLALIEAFFVYLLYYLKLSLFVPNYLVTIV